LQKRTGEAPPWTWTGRFGLLSPHASIYRPGETGGRESEAAEIARYSTSDRTVICDGGTEQDPFTDLRQRKETLREIGASNDPDAHVARVVLALMEGEEPDSADVNKLTEPQTSGSFESVLTGRYVGASSNVPPGRQQELAVRMLRRVKRREE